MKMNKTPQRKNHKSMSDVELKTKLENKIYGPKPKTDNERLEDTIKNKLKDFDRFSIN